MSRGVIPVDLPSLQIEVEGRKVVAGRQAARMLDLGYSAFQAREYQGTLGMGPIGRFAQTKLYYLSDVVPLGGRL